MRLRRERVVPKFNSVKNPDPFDFLRICVGHTYKCHTHQSSCSKNQFGSRGDQSVTWRPMAPPTPQRPRLRLLGGWRRLPAAELRLLPPANRLLLRLLRQTETVAPRGPRRQSHPSSRAKRHRGVCAAEAEVGATVEGSRLALRERDLAAAGA